MRTFEKWFKDEYNEELPHGEINGSWFSEHDLPMIVSCTCCQSTLCLVSAAIGDDDYIYCRCCVSLED